MRERDETSSQTLFTVEASVARLTLNRPQAFNALTPEILGAIRSAVAQVNDDTGIKALVLRGSGGQAFSTGVDLKFAMNAGIIADASAGFAFTASVRDTLIELEQCAAPTIAVVEGYTLAGGLELALACDFMLVADSAKIGDQHANFDLMPGAGSSQRLPRRIGKQAALELLLTGRYVDGAEAVRIGLALRSAPAGELDDLVEDLVGALRGKSRAALTATRAAVRRGLELPLTEALDLERLLSQEYFACHPDALRGLDAFLAGSRPKP
jgi:enoyl-CoA hydratase/carnithine racemase